MDLDEFLRPNNSPITQDRGYYTNLDTDFQFEGVGANKITSGILATTIQLGQPFGSSILRLDGPNNRILINDGTTNRIAIGSV